MKVLFTCLVASLSFAIADSADASFFKKWRHKCPPTNTGGVPEPSSVLGLLGAAGFLVLRRKRK